MLKDSDSKTPERIPKSSFTGRARSRETSGLVRFVDKLALIIITLGGVGTILAVGLVFVFLFSVAVPLFQSPESSVASVAEVDRHVLTPTAFAVNEYRKLGWFLDQEGRINSVRTDTGEILEQINPLPPEKIVSAMAADTRAGIVMFGFADGTLSYGDVRVATKFVTPTQAAKLKDEDAGDSLAHSGGRFIEALGNEQYRLHNVEVSMRDPLPLAPANDAIVAVDHVVRSGTTTVVAITKSGSLLIKRLIEKRNLLLGKTTVTATGGRLEAVALRENHALPMRIMLTGIADTVYLIWRDGHLIRLDTRNIDEPKIVETVDLFEQPDTQLTAAGFMIGRTTLVIGDSRGHVQTLFRIKPESSRTVDGAQLVRVTQFPPGDGHAVTSIAASQRSRLVNIGYADGMMRLFQTTTGELLLEHDIGESAAELLSMAPKDDALYAWSDGRLYGWDLDVKYPAVNLKSIFTPVWYEGYEHPMHVWQSSSGEDAFEEKYGLYPLIFGTLKATFYSMLFGLPLALLAAIYTSEFLHPKTKAKVKPTIEMMASLPSVVLGFLAALVFAPVFEGIVPEFLTALVVVPLFVVFGGYLFQMISAEKAVRLSRFRLLFVFIAIAVGLFASKLLGPVVESLLFAGDIKAWLDGQIGSGFGGWMILNLPLSVVLVVYLFSRLIVGQRSPARSGKGRFELAKADLLRFFLAVAVTISIATGFSLMLTALGFDPRGTFVDTYVQRNALIVGFVMGFAIIPIIYTLADDALSAVPDHLRAASLGCGATPWQTALRIIVPTAMSGLFSAAMIGLGRAVGETMIVLMAAGNTPVMDLNIFNGFRTLSANIAVELPEAVQGGAHYRMLFLAALTLFLMTFVVNTLAEVVRQRFRKRAFAL